MTYTFSFFIMTKETAIGALRVARNGAEMLQVLDALDRSLTREEIMNENKGLGGFDYIESPQIAQVLGVPTLEAVEF